MDINGFDIEFGSDDYVSLTYGDIVEIDDGDRRINVMLIKGKVKEIGEVTENWEEDGGGNDF